MSQRSLRPDSEVLLARLDGYLAVLRSGHTIPPDGIDLVRAEQIAHGLRTLVLETAHASAADRARVRAAVHCFVNRGVIARGTASFATGRGRSRLRVLTSGRPERRMIYRIANAQDSVVNALLEELGRPDLVVPPETATSGEPAVDLPVATAVPETETAPASSGLAAEAAPDPAGMPLSTASVDSTAERPLAAASPGLVVAVAAGSGTPVVVGSSAS